MRWRCRQKGFNQNIKHTCCKSFYLISALFILTRFGYTNALSQIQQCYLISLNALKQTKQYGSYMTLHEYCLLHMALSPSANLLVSIDYPPKMYSKYTVLFCRFSILAWKRCASSALCLEQFQLKSSSEKLLCWWIKERGRNIKRHIWRVLFSM